MRYIGAFLLGILLASPVFVVDFFTIHAGVIRICQRESFEPGDMFAAARTTAGKIVFPAPMPHKASELYDAMAEGSVVAAEWRGGDPLPQMLEKAEPHNGTAPSC